MQQPIASWLCLAAICASGAPGCEPEPVATQPWPVTPRAYRAAPAYGPSLYGAQERPAAWPATMPGSGIVPPAAPPSRRNTDLSLDVPSSGGATTASSDVGDPWDTREAPRAAGSPTTYLVVLVALDKKGNQAARAGLVRKLLAAKGGVKRSEWVWEIPTAQADRTPEILRAELTKVLCDEDHAVLLFADARALAKVEFAGGSPCEPAAAR